MAIKVYDAEGNEKDLLWAMEKYNVKILATPRDVDHWEVVELRENIPNSTLIVRTLPPQAGIAVRFGWPDDAVVQKTNQDGHSGFGMGQGAWYRPGQGECGPHFVEILGIASDRVECLGMRAPAVNHDHLDVTFSFVEGKEEPEPEPEPDCDNCPVRQAAFEARDRLDAALGS